MKNSLQAKSLEKAQNLKLSDLKALSSGIGLGRAKIAHKPYQYSAKPKKFEIPKENAPSVKPKVRSIKSSSVKLLTLKLLKFLQRLTIDSFFIGSFLFVASSLVLVLITIKGFDQKIVKSWVWDWYSASGWIQIGLVWLGLYGFYRVIFGLLNGGPLSESFTRRK